MRVSHAGCLVRIVAERTGWTAATAGAAFASGFQALGNDAEHEGLVVTVGGGSARVVAQFDDGVAPGSRAEDVAHVGHGVAEVVALFVGGEVIANRAASPRGPLVEEILEDLDGCAEAVLEFLDWAEILLWFGWDFGDVVGDEMGAHSGCLLRVYGCHLAGSADGLLDHWVLAIASWQVLAGFEVDNAFWVIGNCRYTCIGTARRLG